MMKAEALANLQEAVELFFEYADEQEIESLLGKRRASRRETA